VIFNTSYEIFVQNLDYGTQISGSSEQSNDGVAEKYCNNNDEAMSLALSCFKND